MSRYKSKLNYHSLNHSFQSSIFTERLIKKGYEIIYLVEPVDEYTIQALPEFDGKRFQNVAKEGVDIDVNKSFLERMEKKYEPLLDWLKSKALFNKIEKVILNNLEA